MIPMDQILYILFSEYQPVRKFSLIPVQKQCKKYYLLTLRKYDMLSRSGNF